MIRDNSQDKPLISVIVPIYNVGPYLEKCLDSICSQSYVNLEILLIVSPSTDNSIDIAESYENKDKRVKILYRPALGLSDARNTGIDHSSGQYLVFIDSDDFIAPCFIDKLYGILIEYDCDIAQAGFVRIESTQNTIPSSSCLEKTYAHVYTNIEICEKMNAGEDVYSTVTWNKIYKRELFSDIRFPVGKLHEDVATTHKLYYSASKIGIVTIPLYFYRQVPTSIVGSPYSLKRLDEIEHTLDRIHYFQEKGEYVIYGEALYDHIVKINSHLMNVRRYIPNSADVQNDLRKKMKETYSELRCHKTISLYKKVIVSMIVYAPHVMIWMVLLRRKIINAFGK